MKIEGMFKKDINRKIRGVITPEKNEELIYQELDEYVVTNELLKHFTKFYSVYADGIMNETVDVGVWISGFFGSGKSHFLKILSYLLDSNLEVKGKKPLDFFKEDEKIKDPIVIGNMESAANTDTDVLLFNIDSKSGVSSSSDKDSILKIFVNVFNGVRGYCDDKPFLAQLEKDLDEEGKYEAFKDEFYSLTNKSWEEKGRSQFKLVRKHIVQSLVNIGFSDYDDAKYWADNEEKTYTYSIEDFAQEINRYCKNKGNNHHVVFLVDEVGQYIADDTQLMLDLQTLVEELGMKCHGKAWLIVTSQQNIDDITRDIKGIDFSKIQGRFKTRLSLSSSNVDEVIRRRILAKNDVAQQVLESEYSNIDAILKNIFTFENSAEMKTYESAKNYADIYPFVPYQFNLVQNVLTSIRIHSASGKHMADGERSMLALFQESAIAVEDYEDGHLVPFNLFYEAVDEFIDHTHSQVINKAANNDALIPFDVEVLKVLFLIKYVKEIKATSKNITTLMISEVNQDRLELNKRVEKALDRLLEQTLIQKNGQVYSFLTDEEQAVNLQIKNEIVDPGEVLDNAANIIFSEIYPKNKYKFSNRYNFLFNQSIDNKKINNKEYDIGLRIITPKYEFNITDSSQTSFGDGNLHNILKGLSESNKEVIIHLLNDLTVFDEIQESLQIRKFLTKKSADLKPELRARKQEEYNDKVARIKLFLESSIKDATIYVKGDKVDISISNVEARIDEAMHQLVSKVYSRLSFMKDFAPDKSDVKKAIGEEHQTKFGYGEDRCANALEALDRHVYEQSKLHNPVTLKSLLNKYSKAPYGFVPLDIQWLVATLFAQKKISLTLNSSEITVKEHGIDKILDYLTNLNYFEKLLIDERVGPDPLCLKRVKDLLKEVYNPDISLGDNDEIILEVFKRENKIKLDAVNDCLFQFKILDKYPGKETLEKAKELFTDINNKKGVSKFFPYVCSIEDELLSLGEKLELVLAFFNGSQKKIFEDACSVYDIYESNGNLINNVEISDTASEIKKIIDMPEPYSEIRHLPELNNSFNTRFDEILEEKRNIVINGVDGDFDSVISKLTDDELKKEFENRIILSFDTLKAKLSAEKNIAVINGYTTQSENIKNKFENEIQEFINNRSDTIPVPLPSEVNVDIKDIVHSTRVKLESEQDIDKFFENIKRELKNKLSDVDSINLRL